MIVRWIVAGIFAPLGILLHECGHAFVATARRCNEVVIHWAFTSSHCPDGSVLGDVIGVGAGPLASWLLVLLGWLATRTRTRPRPEAFVFAVCCAGRALIGVEALAISPSGTDEEKLARLTGIPSTVFVLPQVVLAILTFVWAWRYARRLGIGRDAIAGMLAAAASGALYMFVVGPILLP